MTVAGLEAEGEADAGRDSLLVGVPGCRRVGTAAPPAFVAAGTGCPEAQGMKGPASIRVRRAGRMAASPSSCPSGSAAAGERSAAAPWG